MRIQFKSKSNAQKQKQYRSKIMEKMSEEERGLYWKKESERTTAARKKMLEDPEKRRLYLEKERSRKRKNKTPGKENVCEQVVTPYKTPQSYGKAMRRLECVMPESPRKKKALIEHGLQN